MNSCIPIKTISLELDAYEKLKQAKKGNESFSISIISVTEFLEGFEDISRGERLLKCFAWMEIDSSIARTASRLRRSLRQSENLIGDFDILIAATALSRDMPLVTGNKEHFKRLPDLEVVGYGAFN